MKKNLQNGTSSSKGAKEFGKSVPAYSVQEVCDIIKQCRESGVTQLQIGAFKASFLLPVKEDPGAATPTSEQLAAAKAFESEAFAIHEKRIRLEGLSQLRLTDPEMYEELVARGELENAGKESDGTDD